MKRRHDETEAVDEYEERQAFDLQRAIDPRHRVSDWLMDVDPSWHDQWRDTEAEQAINHMSNDAKRRKLDSSFGEDPYTMPHGIGPFIDVNNGQPSAAMAGHPTSPQPAASIVGATTISMQGVSPTGQQSPDQVSSPEGMSGVQPQPFSAMIVVNAQAVGKLTQQKLELTRQSIFYGDRVVAVAKSGRRILTLGGDENGIEDGVNGVRIRLPRYACSRIDIYIACDTYSCLIDGTPFFEKTLQYPATWYETQDKIRKMQAASDAAYYHEDPGAPTNPWMKLYQQWLRWTDDRLKTLADSDKFPGVPKKIIRCNLPACSLLDQEGVHRPLRVHAWCKHDIKWWFRDAAEGYNERYYCILLTEASRWDPTNIKWKDTKATDDSFRIMAGENWRNARELLDEHHRGIRDHDDGPADHPYTKGLP